MGEGQGKWCERGGKPRKGRREWGRRWGGGAGGIHWREQSLLREGRPPLPAPGNLPAPVRSQAELSVLV